MIELEISGKSGTFTADYSDEIADAFMDVMTWPSREWEIGFPGPQPFRAGELVTVTIPRFEFRVAALVSVVDDETIRLREAEVLRG